MSRTKTKVLDVLAPAKINLYLHVTGKRDNGFHELDSLIAFADIGDRIRIKTAQKFSFSIDGPFSRAFTAAEKDSSPDSQNLAVRAAWALAKAVERKPDVDIRLTKNLPLAAGVGGGSADAAAVIWALLEWWNIQATSLPGFDDMLLSLGADVPACVTSEVLRVRGIGENVTAFYDMEEIPILLVNPLKRCPTTEVFSKFDGKFTQGAPTYEEDHDFISYLKQQRNDLTDAAVGLVPEINDVLGAINEQKGCQLARMSGSGATCFGLFGHEIESLGAAEQVTLGHPDWWVHAGILNSPQRY